MYYFVDNNRSEDFNNTPIPFEILMEAVSIDISLLELIMEDDVNEAKEQLILVIEPDFDDVDFDDFGGVLVLTILDKNSKKMFLCLRINKSESGL